MDPPIDNVHPQDEHEAAILRALKAIADQSDARFPTAHRIREIAGQAAELLELMQSQRWEDYVKTLPPGLRPTVQVGDDEPEPVEGFAIEAGLVQAMRRHRGFEPEDLDAIDEAKRALFYTAERDCYCEDVGDTPTDRITCDVCAARRAVAKLDEVLLPTHKGLHPVRAQHGPESIFAEEWIKENTRHSWLNNGLGTLELLLIPESDWRAFRKRGKRYINETPPVPRVSERDAQVAATVVQWLGTNGGRAFMSKCERLIRDWRHNDQKLKMSHDRQTWGGGRTMDDEPRDYEISEAAEAIAKSYINWQDSPEVSRALARSIRDTFEGLLARPQPNAGLVKFLRLALDSFERDTAISGGEVDNQHRAMCKSARQLLDDLEHGKRRKS